MKPPYLHTRIFLDGGDPLETASLLGELGFLDGQTTNPSLVAKNPEVRQRIDAGEKFTLPELLGEYRAMAQKIAALIPEGSVSLEVYADAATSAEDMLREAREMHAWIPNAHIKFPIIRAGIRAAALAIEEGMRVNMTLCFSEEQAVAVASALRHAQKGAAFISPFIGRLDDQGRNGMDLIANIARLYREAGSSVEVLAASIRNEDHFLASIARGADIVTAPFGILSAWAAKGAPLPAPEFVYAPELAPIPYRSVQFPADWESVDITHPLTDNGLQRFNADWQNLLR